MTNDQLWKLLDSIQAQIRAFDTKAQVALGIDSILAGLLGTEIVKGLELANWRFDYVLASFLAIATLSVVSLLASALFGIFTVVPRLHLNQPKSHFFFCHLVEIHGRKFEAAAKSLIALGPEEVAHQLATQAQTIAIICDVKATRSLHALRLMTISLILYVHSAWSHIARGPGAHRL
jgi:hypothetical protein